MAISESQLASILQQSFPNARIKITDIAGDRDHYSVDITCNSFKGLPLIKQHRLVKEALSNVLKKDLHAVTIKTRCN